MTRSKRQFKALQALNLDLFRHPVLTPPASATLYNAILNEARENRAAVVRELAAGSTTELPPVTDLYRLFDEYNLIYFGGKLPKVRIEYSTRMSSAGSYTPSQMLIRIGRRYHEIFPEDLADTLKHEMIHLIHLNHDKAFRDEARRIGTSLKAKPHPSLHKPPRYIYACPNCGREYPRQKRLRMSSCGSCAPRHYDARYKLRLLPDKNTAKQ